MLSNLNEVKDKINDWDTTLLAVFYHDSIYKASSSTNEGDSAKLAMQKLSEMGYPAPKIANCANMILATKLHEKSEDNDTNYLLDADLAILGANPYEYQKYTEQIREEYAIYPDFMYNTGRKKHYNTSSKWKPSTKPMRSKTNTKSKPAQTSTTNSPSLTDKSNNFPTVTQSDVTPYNAAKLYREAKKNYQLLIINC